MSIPKGKGGIMTSRDVGMDRLGRVAAYSACIQHRVDLKFGIGVAAAAVS